MFLIRYEYRLCSETSNSCLEMSGYLQCVFVWLAPNRGGLWRAGCQSGSFETDWNASDQHDWKRQHRSNMNERLFGVKPSVFLVCCPEECRRRKRLTGQQHWKHGHDEDRGGPHALSPLSKNRKTVLDYWLYHTLGESNDSMITTNTAPQECRTSLPAVKQTHGN